MRARSPRRIHGGRWLRWLAALGFLCALVFGYGGISRQLAVATAQQYVAERTGAYAAISMDRVRLMRLKGGPIEGHSRPPLGLVWSIELHTGALRGEVRLNAFTHDLVDYNVRLGR